jgi:hypothetical protein
MAALTVTPDNVQTSPAAVIANGDAAVDILAGQLVYKDALNKFNLANGASGTVSPVYKVFGMALDSAGPNQPLQVVVSDPDLIIGGTTPVGTTLILGVAPGAIAPNADEAAGVFKSVVGVVTALGHVNFKIVRADAPMA